MRTLTGGLTKPKPESNERLQLNALELALRAFGLQEEAPAATMNLARGSKTGLTRLNVHEDGVIEHDARVVPGYENDCCSSCTGMRQRMVESCLWTAAYAMGELIVPA